MLVTAIDTSSAQGLSIGGLIDLYKPQHVVVKLYQSIELSGNGAQFSVEQAKTAQQKGCSTSGYGWLYTNIDGARQVTSFLDTASKAQLPLGPTNPLWLDCEDYTDGSYPSLSTISQAVQECERRGVFVGIYTGGPWWRKATGNSTQFSYLPLWLANYNGHTVLESPGFGGWTACAGHQWSGNPIDRSVFDARFATPHGG